MTTDYKTITLIEDDAPDLEFIGIHLGTSPEAIDEPASTRYSLYKTESGKFVCHTFIQSHIAQVEDENSVAIFDTEDEVIYHFGQSIIAKALYRTVGFKNTRGIES